MSRIDGFIAYLESHVGDMYVWGAQGQRVDTMDDPETWISPARFQQLLHLGPGACPACAQEFVQTFHWFLRSIPPSRDIQ